MENINVARCGCMMDPGEGRNGMCDDCVTGDRAAGAQRRIRPDDPVDGF